MQVLAKRSRRYQESHFISTHTPAMHLFIGDMSTDTLSILLITVTGKNEGGGHPHHSVSRLLMS